MGGRGEAVGSWIVGHEGHTRPECIAPDCAFQITPPWQVDAEVAFRLLSECPVEAMGRGEPQEQIPTNFLKLKLENWSTRDNIKKLSFERDQAGERQNPGLHGRHHRETGRRGRSSVRMSVWTRENG